MTITRMQAQLARLDAGIKKLQVRLADLRSQRKELRALIAEAKKGAREGKPLPEAEGIAERIGQVLSEKVVHPIAELLHPSADKPGP